MITPLKTLTVAASVGLTGMRSRRKGLKSAYHWRKALKNMQQISLNFKDILYLVAYLVSIISVFFAFKGRIGILEKEIQRLSRAVFADQGSLMFIDKKLCKEHRDQIFTTIRKSENILEQALGKIDVLSQNVLRIMFKLEITGDEFDKRDNS